MSRCARSMPTWRSRPPSWRRLDGSGSGKVGARLSVLPAQQPRPPIWIGAHVRSAVERAAALSDGWIASANASLVELQEKIGWFKEAAKAAGTRGEVIVM